MEKTKRCSKCGKELPLSEFNKSKRAKDGLQWMCKECMKQYDKQWHAEKYSTIERYAYIVRYNNLQKDIKHGRCGKDEDPLPTIEQYIELLQQVDFYDGKQYHWSEMGLDRIDNSKAHTIDNVVPCTTEHNRQRQKMPFKEFCELMRKENELELVL